MNQVLHFSLDNPDRLCYQKAHWTIRIDAASSVLARLQPGYLHVARAAELLPKCR
jgi:hypothetical protein